MNFFNTIEDPNTIITAIDNSLKFPEILDVLKEKYDGDIKLFIKLINEVNSSAELLNRIRSNEFGSGTRMSLLKMFRRCVSPVLDTETTKKIQKISTESLVENFGYTFKSIEKLKKQFSNISEDALSALAALIGEYDNRGQSGYELTELFFTWFEEVFKNDFIIEGPRGAGRDIELCNLFSDFKGNCPCDFAIKNKIDGKILAIGFARYDSTRGGAQSDDRTGGNANKVEKARAFSNETGLNFKIIFLSDGPGLSHKDTWEESCLLDGSWNDNVRVTTLKTAGNRITLDWLKS